MPKPKYIPIGVVRRQLSDIEARLQVLGKEAERNREETARLQLTRKVLSDLEQRAVQGDATPNKSHSRVSGSRQDAIPDGRVATPIVLEMIGAKPGITSIEIFNALEPRVTKKGPKSPRKFLGDLIWELGHRNRLRREANGGLYLVEQEQGGTK